MKDCLQIGRIINTHGVRGEVKILPLTDNPDRYLDLDWVYIEKDGKLQKLEIEGIKFFKNQVIAKFKGIDVMDKAEALKNLFVLVDREHAIKLPEDAFFICDLLGCMVYDEEGKTLGELADVLHTGSNDVYVVKGENGKEILIPALKTVVKEVSIKDRSIKVTLPEGLLDDEV